MADFDGLREGLRSTLDDGIKVFARVDFSENEVECDPGCLSGLGIEIFGREEEDHEKINQLMDEEYW